MFGQPADPEILKAYEEAGATRAMVFADSAPRDQALRQIGRFRQQAAGLTPKPIRRSTTKQQYH